MCGINGIAFADRAGKREIEPETLLRMRDEIRHRGPDDAGIFLDQNIGLGHRRLSIVDVKNGHQPMLSDDLSCVLVYNGEVYNHTELRPGLIRKGYKFKTTSDTETILNLYKECGKDFVHQLRGMFALAIWDKRTRELLLVRDRFGVKPLYYHHDERGDLYFGSEIKSLLRAGIAPTLNFGALPDQLANHGTSDDQTLYREIKRVQPGHYLTWHDGRITTTKYWDLSFEPKLQDISDQDATEEWHRLFQKSVELRLMSDVPLGVFLSGGIDSSAICAAMAKVIEEPVKSFSVGFEEKEANEFDYARLVARTFNTRHHEITITPAEFFHELPNLVWHEDEPLGFIASVPLYFVSKLAQQHVKVVLTGEGSDEILGGYSRYKKALQLINYGRRYETAVPGFARAAIRSGITRFPYPVGSKLSRTFLTRGANLEELFWDNFSVFPAAMQARLFTDETKARIVDENPYHNQTNWVNGSNAGDLLDKLLYSDTKTYLHELLMKQDQMSMAASIESRVPFLDHKLVEYTARLPSRMKIRGGETKWILRQAMRSVLPQEVLTRAKMGFPVPIGAWFRGKYRQIVEEFVLGDRSVKRGIFDPVYVQELVNRHYAGENHDERLWALVNFEIWQRTFFDGESVKGIKAVKMAGT
jgi:asparagine synthase (glutamine-hydrolysing)